MCQSHGQFFYANDFDENLINNIEPLIREFPFPREFTDFLKDMALR